MSKYEYCCKCGEATGRAGADEDSLYTKYDGPFCETCYPDSELPAAQPAAPDLLASLQRMVAQFESVIRSEYEGTSMLDERLAEADHARAAIARATGGAV
jgi:hypothetical protein